MTEQVADWIALGLSIFLLIILGIIGVFDFVMLFSGQQGRTVSEYVYTWSLRLPIIPFAAGVIAGHLWFK